MDEVNFQWDEGNRQHIIHAYPERSNTQDEVESLFDDTAFLSVLTQSTARAKYDSTLSPEATKTEYCSLFM